jgi:D-threo-aldose 1-dehydrogenase
MRTRATRRGIRLTELGLGAAQLGNLARETTPDEVVATVDTAWEAGIRYFDTAPHYGVGLSERRLGEQLRSRPRDAYVLSTKVGRLLEASPSTAHLRDDGGFDVPRDPVRRWDFTRDGVLRSVEESLQRLGLDRVDLVFLHDADQSGQFETALTEGVQALIELREQGVIGGVGAGMNEAGPLTELIRRADVDTVMCANAFTLLRPDALDELLPLAVEREVSVVAAAVYNSGLLANPRPAPGTTFVYGPVPPEVLDRTNRIADVCERYGVTLPVVAIAYVLRHPAVVSVVAGARGRDQVQQNVDRAQTPVPEELWGDLEREGLIPAQAA